MGPNLRIFTHHMLLMSHLLLILPSNVTLLQVLMASEEDLGLDLVVVVIEDDTTSVPGAVLIISSCYAKYVESQGTQP